MQWIMYFLWFGSSVAPSSPTKTGSTTLGKIVVLQKSVMINCCCYSLPPDVRKERKTTEEISNVQRNRFALVSSPEKNIRRRFPSSISSLQTDLLRAGNIQIARPLCAPVNERRGCVKEKAQLSGVRASLSLRAAVCLHSAHEIPPPFLSSFSSPPPPPSFSPECPCSAYRGSTRVIDGSRSLAAQPLRNPALKVCHNNRGGRNYSGLQFKQARRLRPTVAPSIVTTAIH